MKTVLYCIILFFAAILFLAGNAKAGEEKLAYRYTDESGFVHIVSSIGLVPENRRKEAVAMRYETISKGEPKVSGRNRGKATLEGSGGAVEVVTEKGRFAAPAFFDGVEMRMANIDTGSEMCVITTKLAKALGYDIRKARKGFFATPGGRLDAPVVTLKSLTIGPARLTGVRAVVTDFSWRGETSAIIGMNFLSRFVFAIDSGNNSLAFYPSALSGPAGSESVSSTSSGSGSVGASSPSKASAKSSDSAP